VKDATMQLIKKYPEPGAVINFIQLSHRREAIDGVIAAIAKMYAAEAANADPLAWDAGVMKDWLAETVLQGAYLREYHLWEKDCKAYFAAMAGRNGRELILKSKRGQTFAKVIEGTLVAFDVAMPVEIMSALEIMRQRVNVMKHDVGLELDHFVSDSDYADAINALERFWEFLAAREKVTG
jgi:hypothetical protein